MSEKVLRVGLLGVGRGHILWDFCKVAKNAKLVAVCDKWQEGIEIAKKKIGDDTITYYSDFDTFLKHDMDVVFLANYATEHAPFAMKAMRAGIDVISEVLPVQTMAQAVVLLECIEETGRKYCYAENYCYMTGPSYIKNRYQKGALGEFEYGEGEYMHNCESIWDSITRGDPNHWRNTMSAFYYCTHSAGPLLHISGQRPVKVVGIEAPFNARMARMGAKAGNMAVEIATLENGGIIKSIHGVGPSKNSIWYSVYGTKGRMETAREDAEPADHIHIVYENLDSYDGANDGKAQKHNLKLEQDSTATTFGHGGSDYICLSNAFAYLMGDENADIVDAYEALDMWMIGFFGYLSVLEGGTAQAIPDLRKPEEWDRYRNDTRCTEPAVAGDQLQPSYSKGNPQIDPAIYASIKAAWDAKQKEKD